MATKSDAVALLKAEHRKVGEFFAKFAKARDAGRRKALADEICTELCVHATMEERIFYPACKDVAEEDLIKESHVGHDAPR